MNQSGLPDHLDIEPVSTDRVEAKVWVVTANYADDPHPHTLGVYSNEEAAKELIKECRSSVNDLDRSPIAWEMHERPIQQEYDPGNLE